MTKPFLSIIIPTHDSAGTLTLLLHSIFKSKFKNFELIIVDDASPPSTRETVRKFQKNHPDIIYLRTRKKMGAGAARNLGARSARGQIISFLDDDFILPPETLSYLVEDFGKKDINAVVGTMDKKPANPKPGLFHYFRALNYYSYWVNERVKGLPIGGFGGALGSMRRELFQRVGGWYEGIKGAGMEDQEMAWRINETTPIFFDPRISIPHHMAGFWESCKKFYERSYQWAQLFEKHKKFFSPAMNLRELVTAGLANLSTLLFFSSLLLPRLWPFFLIFFGLRLFAARKFLVFIFKEKGLSFLLASFLFSHILYLATYIGGIRYLVEKFSREI